MSLSAGAERRSGSERRSGGDRRLRSQGVPVGPATERAPRDREPGPLGRLLPHARFNETEAAQRTAAIAAHQGELSARLGRNVGLSVAALDYLLNISGDLIAPTIVEHEILEVLEHRSVTDPLTGLFNRYHFEATLKREAARCLRHRSPLSLLLLDVDGLKAVNDRWGHQRGDQMLARVAGAFQAFWDDLAGDLGAAIDVVGPADAVTSWPETAAVIVAAGGAERDATQWLETHTVRPGLPALVVGTDPGRRMAMQLVARGASD